MSENTETIVKTVVIHPVTGEKEVFSGSSVEEVNRKIEERFGSDA